MMLIVGATTMAQTEKATLAVLGNCEMCKARIEKASLKTKGVKYAIWQAETEQLNVIYNSKKTSVTQIAKNIAAVGHQANGIAVSDSVYAALPSCCQYVIGNPHKQDHLHMEHAP